MILRRLLMTAWAAVAIVANAAAAGAGGVAVSIRPQPDAPVQLSKCTAAIQFQGNGFGVISSFLNTGADFKNVSDKVAVAVLVRLRLANAFGDELGTLFGQATGQFSKDAL